MARWRAFVTCPYKHPFIIPNLQSRNAKNRSRPMMMDFMGES
jgi:hypothetical protein